MAAKSATSGQKVPQKARGRADAPAEARIPDWLSIDADRPYRATVALSAHDSAVILALTRGFRAKVEALRAFVLRVIPEEGLAGAGWAEVRGLAAALLTEENVEQLVAIMDDVLARAIAEWELRDMAGQYGLGDEERALLGMQPAAMKAEVRTQAFDLLPGPYLLRLLQGLLVLSGNSSGRS